MKRRKRKRGAKEVSPPQGLATSETPKVDLAEPAQPERVSSPSLSSEAEPAPETALPTAADRRAYPRYEFSAAVEVTVAESGTRIETRLRDLSQQGCYADTTNALPLGTMASVRIMKGAQSLEAGARVVYSRAGNGMGLAFVAIDPEQAGTLETWLDDS